MGHRTIWAFLLACMLILQIASFGIRIEPVYANHQFLLWSDGSSFTTFGPNEHIIIDTGAIDFLRCPEGASDFFFPVASIWIIRSDLVPTVGSDILLSNLDPAFLGFPNTVFGTSSPGGVFIDELIGFTAPGGRVGSGTYAVIYDECQDDTLDAEDAVFNPAFEVVIPVDADPLPSIGQLKNDSFDLAKEYFIGHALLNATFIIEELTGKITPKDPADKVLSLVQDSVSKELRVNPRQVALRHCLNMFFHYRGIAADPPDPDFQRLTVVGAREVIDPESNDLLNIAAAEWGTVITNEEQVVLALLSSMERYQGADAADNGEWALIHARSIQKYADLLAKELLPDSKAAIARMEAAVLADTKPLDDVAADLEAFRIQLQDPGFTQEQIKVLRELGLSDTEIEKLRTDFVAVDFLGAFSKAALVDSLRNLQNDYDSLIQEMQNLAVNIGLNIANLAANPSVEDKRPAANAGGPYTGTEGVPILFDGTGSTSPSSIISYEWDLDGDGIFDDASGPNPSFTYSESFQGLVGLRVTNSDGLTNVDYSAINVVNINTPPRIDLFSPDPRNATVELGSSVNFSVAASDPDGDSIMTDWLVDLTQVASGPSFDFMPVDPSQVGMHIVRAVVSDESELGGLIALDWAVSVFFPDADGDDWRANVDCDDTDPDVNPGMAEIIGNSTDDDCNPDTLDSGNPPIAESLEVITNEDTQVDIVLAAQDPDLGQTLTFSIVIEPSRGTLSGTAPNLIYIPDPGFIGLDSLTFKANDGIFDSNEATVNITVQPSRPVANDQSVSTNRDTPLDIILTATDPNKDPLSLSIVSDPAHGTLSSINSPIPTPEGLVAWWPSDDNAEDVIGSHHGTLQNGAAFAPGMVGEAFSLDGVDDYVQIPDNDIWAFDTNDFTIDLWVNFNSVKLSSPFAPGEIFVGHDSGEGLKRKWLFALGGGMLYFHTVSRFCVCFLAPAAFSPNLNQWYHLALTKSGETYTIFVDGDPVSSHTVDRAGGIPVPDVNAPLTIGWAEGPGFVDGLIDDVEIYNRALSQSEIQAIFNAGSLGKAQPGLSRGLMTYTPDLDYVGPDSFEFKANDGFLDSNVATVSIDVTLPPNNPPVANDQSISTSINTTVDITLTGSDPDGDPLTFSIVSDPSFGTLSGTPPDLIYSPDPGTTGTDSFTFKVNDGQVDSSTATVSIAVRAPVQCPGGVFVTGHDPDFHAHLGSFNAVGAQHIIQRAIAFVTFENPNPAILLVTSVQDPGGGFSDPRLGLTDAGFAFDVADFGSGTPGVLDLDTVNFGNYDVVVVASDFGGWLRQAELDILNARSAELIDYVNSGGGLIAFAESPTGSGLTDSNPYGFLPFVVSTVPVDLFEEGITVTAAGEAMGLTNDDVNGNFFHNIFTTSGGMDIIDHDPNGNIISLAIRCQTITPDGVVNDPPVADGQSVETNEDTPVTITLTGSDIDGDSLTFSQVTGPANGQLVITGAVTCNATAPSLCSVPATYIPDLDYNGPDNFTFKTNDGNLDSNIATVNITVNPVDDSIVVVNDDPVANDDTVETSENTAKDIPFTDVLANDSDPDGDALSVIGVGAASHGSVSIVDQAIRYVPDSSFTGVDTFTYDISDGFGGTATATVTVNVIPVNEAPILQPIDDQVIDEGTTLNVSISATDPDGTVPSLAASGLPSFASFTDNNDGTGTINLAPGFDDAGNYPNIQIIASDGSLTDTKIFTIIVNDVNHAPTANDQSVSTDQNTLVFIALTGGDLDQDALTFSTVSEPISGTLLGSGQNMVYVPDLDFFGGDNFRFIVNDGNLDSNVATVSINVNAGNNAPHFDVPPTPVSNTTFDIFTGETFSFDVQCSDPDAGDTVVFGSFTLPTDATLTPPIPEGNPAIGTFNWTPTSLQTLTLTLICTDSHGIFVQHSISIAVSEPPIVQGKITAGGAQIDKDTNFGFNVQSPDGITLKGELEYQDRSMNINLHSVEMTSLSISEDKTKGKFTGTATVNREPGFTFVVEVEDNGEPGRNDKFKITIPELSYTKSGTLEKGNIQIHKKP